MSLNRRQFMQVSGALLCAGALPHAGRAAEPESLPIPPLLEAKGGRPVFISLQSVNWSFSPDKNAPVWGFNGRYLGPTIRVYNGDNVKLSCTNQLYETVSLTISGLQCPGAIINNPARVMRPDASWAPVLPIRQSACTCWYHANTPKNMARHVYSGLAGMWYVEDARALVQGLPNQYGIDDFPIILQDKRFGFSGGPEYRPPYSDGFLGDTLLTNGVIEPFISVAKTWIRLRLLNASNSRRYTLGLSNQQPMYLIAGDLGLLDAPVAIRELYLAPGERKEILIDMSNTDEVSLVTGTRRSFTERLRGIFEISSVLSATKALTLRSNGLSPAMQIPVPERFNVDGGVNYSAQRSRRFTLRRDGTINDQPWKSERIDVRVATGEQERWLVDADFAQPFHVQGAEFQVVSIGGKAPPDENRGWKDTVWVDEPVELLVRFPQRSSDKQPFLYYSQNLELADAGAMGQLVVS